MKKRQKRAKRSKKMDIFHEVERNARCNCVQLMRWWGNPLTGSVYLPEKGCFFNEINGKSNLHCLGADASRQFLKLCFDRCV